MSNFRSKKYTRISDILYPFSGIDKVPTDLLDSAAKRGSKVHKICEGIISGFGEIDVDHVSFPYVKSFKSWWSPSIVVKEMEHRLYDNDELITGQLDLLIESSKGLSIIDFKTSYKPSKTWPAQGAAYAYLAKKNGYDIKKIQFLHLSKLGKAPKIYEYPVDDDFFLCILRVWRHFYEKRHSKSKQENAK